MSSPTVAQALIPDPGLEDRPIQSISVTARDFTAQDVKRMTGLREGMPFSVERVRATLQPLYQTGLFRDIRIDAQQGEAGILLLYHFSEKIFVGKVNISGHTFSTKKIRNALQLPEGSEFSTDAWREALTRLMNFYHRNGYFQPQITLDTIPQEKKTVVDLEIGVQQGPRVRLSSIRFTGNRALPDVLLYLTLGIAEGYYNADHIDKGMKKLVRLYEKRGYLQATIGPPEIRYDEALQEITLVIPLEAGTQVRIYFTGSFEKQGLFWRKPLENQLLIKEQSSIDQNVLEESRERLEQFYRDQGYLFARVAYRREDFQGENRVNITFDIQSGSQVLLMDIRFKGNESVQAKELRKVLTSKETGILLPRYIQPKTIDPTDLRALASYYRSRGFLDVRVESELMVHPKGDRADLLFKIEEGVQTFIEEIRFNGNLTFTDEKLLSVSELSAGNPFNFVRAREAEFKILSLYSSVGYAYATVALSPTFSEDRHGVVLAYTVVEDQPAFIGRIFPQGNTYTEDHVILRELLIRTDDPYDEEKIRLSVQRLYRLGFLSEVRIGPIREEKEYVRDLLLSVRERKAGALEFGVGYGEVERFRGFVEASHSNLFGTGRRLSLRAELSQIDEKYVMSYKEPWVFSFAMDGQAALIYQVEELKSFDRRTIGGTVGLDKSFSDYTKGSIQYRFEQNKCEEIEANAVLTQEDLQRITVGSIIPSLVRDSRDDPFNPTRGSVNGIIIKDSAKLLGSETQFVKTTLQSSWYQSLTDWLVVGLSGRGGFAQKFGETEAIHCSERFFLGGRSTIRGYSLDTVGVNGQTLINLTPTGGNAMLLFNTEFRVALPKRFGLVLFVDGGNVWEEYPEVQLSDFKYSVGTGLRYNTPVGPFRLDWGYKLNREEDESAWELHFTLGHTF